MTSQASKPQAQSFLKDPFVLICTLIVLLGAGGFAVWSATAKIAQGVTAGGILIAENRRHSVQHLEGGIIRDLSISEGATVVAGQVAMTIADAGSAARLSQATAEQLSLLADLDLYSAHATGAERVTFERLTAELATPEDGVDLIALNDALFQDQRAALTGEKALIDARIQRLLAEENVLEVRRSGKKKEILSLQEELEIQRSALQRQLGNVSRVNELNRQLTIAETQLAEIDVNGSVIRQSIREAELELNQVDLRFRANISKETSEASNRLAAIVEELAALRDRQHRSAVVIPVDGVIIDLAYTATGGIVGPGERIFDIVPNKAQYQIEVRFRPGDRDDLVVGKPVNLRFGTLDPINPPEIYGTLDTIAADATLDQASNSYYYLATVTIPDAQLERLSAFEIAPGIPVEVFFDKGSPQTPISYFIEPIAEMLRLGMRS